MVKLERIIEYYQNIRFLFIFLAFFELYEFIALKFDPELTNYLVEGLNSNDKLQRGVATQWQTLQLITTFILQWISYLYYLGHLTILFVVQLGVYFVLSFWLFFFLYTTFLLQPVEKYFFYQRAAL